MKLAFVFALGLLAVGCSAPSSDSASNEAAVSATNEDRVCFAVSGHPFNGNGEVWQFDGTSLLHTQTFYWHGTAMRDFLGEDKPVPTVFPILENTDTRLVASDGDAASAITIDIDKSRPIWTAVMHQPGTDDIVFPEVRSCR